jgi:hypothetical protein
MQVHMRSAQDGRWYTKELPDGVPLVTGEDLRDPEHNTVPTSIQLGGECPANPKPPEPPVLHVEKPADAAEPVAP